MKNSEHHSPETTRAIEVVLTQEWQRLLTNNPAMEVTTVNAATWQQLITTCEDIPLEYLWPINQYYNSYYASNGTASWLPYVLYVDGLAVAIWPIHIMQAEGKTSLLGATSAVLPPLFIDPVCSAKRQKRIVKLCLQWCLSIAESFNIKAMDTTSITGPNETITWHNEWMSAGANLACHHECVADLSLPEQQYKKHLPKGCLAAIKRSLKLWRFEVLTQMTDSQRDAFAALHFKAAGKKTRSGHSWSQQQALINKGCSFAVFVYSDQTLVGAAQFLYHQRHASYGFAAYDRSLFHLPIGHGAQYIAIEYMRQQGITHYLLGNRCFAGEWFAPSPKEQNIGKFKAGFATQFNLKQTLTIHRERVIMNE